MKESISIDIEPSVGHMDFIGPINDSLSTSSAASVHSNSSSQLLTGTVTIKLAKAMKFKAMAVKLKGLSRVSHYVKITDKSPKYNIGSPLLPKLKTKLISKSSIFPAGEHIIPWELEIPNIYPRSFSATKRGTIQYKVELKIQLGIQKTITADRSIFIRRHMVPSLGEATLVRSNIYESKTSNFYCELEAPSIICIEQGYLPILIKHNRPVKSVCTQFIQTEIYRCRNITRQEADMGIMASTKENMGNSESGEHGTYKLVKRIQPITLHTIDPDDANHIPLLLMHDLERHTLALTPGLESPLVVIQHQIELTFNFGEAQEEFRVQIPVIVSSVPGSFPTAAAVAAAKNNKETMVPPTPTTTTPTTTTPTEKAKYWIENQLHKSPLSVEVLDTTPHKERVGHSSGSNKSTFGDSTISFSSMKDSSFSFMDDDRRSVKKATSDQNFQDVVSSSSKSMIQPRRRSITPPPKLNRNRSTTTTSKPNTIDTQLANRWEASMSMKSPYTPNTTVDSTPLNSSTAEIFSGLLPPPRRAHNKKKQSTIELTLSRSSSTTTSQSSRTVMQSVLGAPLPPLPPPTSHDRTIGSRPTSPNSTYVATNGYSLSSSAESLSTTPPPLSPPPRTPTVLRKRSNTTATTTAAEDYTNHYFGAELPPIPPPMTRQRLPSLPNENGTNHGDEVVDKEENRKTRMYYEEESDEDAYGYDDDMDYSNFYLINQRD